jgi:hypothetical protein
MALFMDTIQCEQVFSRNSLGFLWAKRDKLDPGQRSILDSLYMGRKKGTLDGVLKVEYRLPKTGVGKLGFGRCYGTKGSLETLERECRGTMCREFYDDIDVVNCHPVLLHQFAQRIYQAEMPEVEKYCDNREAYLKQIHDSKDEAKQAVLKVFYNGKNEFPFLAPMVTEIRNFIKRHLMEDKNYEELLTYVRKQEANTYGAFLSHILQTEERKVMLAMRESFIRQGFSVDVLAYDGVMLRKGQQTLTAEHLRNAERDILQATHYNIKLVNKPFEFFEVTEEQKEESEEIAPKVLKVDYERKKVMFEESSFFFAPTCFIVHWNGKELIQYSQEQAMTVFVEYDFKHSATNMMDSTSFIKLWLKDPTRRTIHAIDMKPSDDPTVFSPPLQFKYQTLEKMMNPKAVELFQQLLKVVCNHHVETYNYLLSWLAQLIQKPFENPKTCIFLTGKKGCGKDTLFDLFIQWIIGTTYSHNYESTLQFWDKHDISRENKMFVKVEEVQGAVNRQHASEFKARVTSHSITVNPKGEKPRTSAHYCRYGGTTNEPQPWKTEDDERRAFVIPCSPEWCGKHEQWDLIRKTLFCAEGASSVGQWLSTVPIDTWDSRKIPKTEYMAQSAEAETTAEASFLESWNGTECTMEQLYTQYAEHCRERNIVYAGNSKSFGIRLLEFIRDGTLMKVRMATGMRYKKPGM